MLDSKPTNTLKALGQTLSQYDGEPLMNKTLYRNIVGALQYVTITFLNLSFCQQSMLVHGQTDNNPLACSEVCSLLPQRDVFSWLTVAILFLP